MKFNENLSKGSEDMERTRKCKRWNDGLKDVLMDGLMDGLKD